MQVRLELLDTADFPQIVEWVNRHDPDFIVQWAGLTYTFPLTLAQLHSHYHRGINSQEADVFIYRIVEPDHGRFVGTVQLCRFEHEREEAVVGRFLIGEESQRGRGIGKAALHELAKIGFGEMGLKRIRLNVFDCNARAVRCYESAGFKQGARQENIYRSGTGQLWSNIEMALSKEDYQSATESGAMP